MLVIGEHPAARALLITFVCFFLTDFLAVGRMKYEF